MADRFEAYFRTDRPRRGLNENMEVMADDGDDIAAALILPPHHMSCLVWRGDSLDVSATIARILTISRRGRMLSLATYTAELELDIATTWYQMHQ